MPDGTHGIRLDRFLSRNHSNLSRSRIQNLIRNGSVQVNDTHTKPSYQLKPRDHVSLMVPRPSPLELVPEEVPFSVIFEDSWIMVLYKPPGIVVHPAPGHSSGTLVHGLLKYCKDLSGIGGKLRPGIVHRLDKDTSGLMLVAKNDMAHQVLSQQFKSGTIKKEYIALVHGIPSHETGRIDLPISRHPVRRKKMAVSTVGGRNALTLWKKIADCKEGFSLLSITIKTGRTHQIRVHFSHLGHPLVGDTVYGHGPDILKRRFLKQNPLLVSAVKRQMLHAAHIGFVHPRENTYMEFESPFPEDMNRVLNALDINIDSLQTNA
ncbi:MAG: RluA family pseudouridine synthase [Deltaproteobacteria bacterium]|nr:RluA family pseudouridine synthase [Deltaproteobacteria bacterium]